MDGEYTTKDGHEVRILVVDSTAITDFPVIAEIVANDESVIYESFTKEGKFYLEPHHHKLDLIPKVCPVTGFTRGQVIEVKYRDEDVWTIRYFDRFL